MDDMKTITSLRRRHLHINLASFFSFADPIDPFLRLSGVDDLDAVTSERLDQLTRISESSTLADTEEITSERLDQMTSERLDQLTRISESSALADTEEITSERLDQMTSERLACVQETGCAGADGDEWPESGEDSDTELHVSDPT